MNILFLFTALIIIGTYFGLQLLAKLLSQLANLKQVHAYRLVYLTRLLQIAGWLGAILLLSVLWGLDYQGLWLVTSSLFAVIGVALFAQWSLLSNITASVVIFFAFPYRIGDKVKIVDKDDSIIGVIEHIGMFHLLIKDDYGNIATYPNAMMLQKAVIKINNEQGLVRKSHQLPQRKALPKRIR